MLTTFLIFLFLCFLGLVLEEKKRMMMFRETRFR